MAQPSIERQNHWEKGGGGGGEEETNVSRFCAWVVCYPIIAKELLLLLASYER